jgi:MFS family permease
LTNATQDSQKSIFISVAIVFCLSLVMVAAGAARGAFGVFFTPMAKELGWSAAQLSSTFSFSMIIEGIFSAISGRLSDKYGTKIVIIVAGLISTIGFVLMSFVNTIWQMYLVYGITMGIGLGGLFIPVVSYVAKKFTSQRSLITGITMSSNGVGQLIVPIIAYQLIVMYSWRTSYIIQGLAVFVLTVIPILFLKRPNAEKQTASSEKAVNQKSFNPFAHNYSFSEARKTGLFWMMIIMQACYAYCFLSALVHIAPYVITIGISSFTAANILSCLGAATIAGRLGMGALADRIGSRKTMLIGFTSLTASLALLLLTQEVWSLFIFACLCGFGVGGISASQSPMTAEYFGLKSHGAIFGAIAGATVILGAMGPLVTGFLFDSSGNYQGSFMVCGLISLAGLVLCSLLRRPKHPPQ